MKKKSLYCPHCQREIPLEYALYRCEGRKAVEPGNAGNKHDQGLFYFRAPSSLFGLPPTQVICPQCHEPSALSLYCPVCHHKLGETNALEEEIVVAITGPSGCGKTVYISALMQELKNTLPRVSDYSALEVQDPLDSGGFLKNYVLENGMPLPAKTAAGEIAAFKFHLVSPKKHRPSFYLVLVDAAGENFASSSEIQIEKIAHIASADAFFVLVDPLQNAVLRSKMGKDIIASHDSGIRFQESLNYDGLELISREYRSTHPAYLKRRLPLPLKICVTMCDVLPNYYQSVVPPFLKDHQGKLDPGLREGVSRSLRSALLDWGEEELVTYAEKNYEEVEYFGVSSLGSSPQLSEKGKMPTNLSPLNVLDPLLALLQKEGKIQ